MKLATALNIASSSLRGWREGDPGGVLDSDVRRGLDGPPEAVGDLARVPPLVAGDDLLEVEGAVRLDLEWRGREASVSVKVGFESVATVASRCNLPNKLSIEVFSGIKSLTFILELLNSKLGELTKSSFPNAQYFFYL